MMKSSSIRFLDSYRITLKTIFKDLNKTERNAHVHGYNK